MTLNDILNGLRAWENARKDALVLENLFVGAEGFELEMGDFPLNTPIHVYPMVNDGILEYALISEAHDIACPDATLLANIRVVSCKHDIGNAEIKKKEALQRINSWKTTYTTWIGQDITAHGALYQNFYMPTDGLSAQPYNVNFALKTGSTPGLKDADLVLANMDGTAYYDTVRREPPYVDRASYYLLDLV